MRWGRASDRAVAQEFRIATYFVVVRSETFPRPSRHRSGTMQSPIGNRRVCARRLSGTRWLASVVASLKRVADFMKVRIYLVLAAGCLALAALADSEDYVLPLADHPSHSVAAIAAKSVTTFAKENGDTLVGFRILYTPQAGSDGITRHKGFSYNCATHKLVQTEVALVDGSTFETITSEHQKALASLGKPGSAIRRHTNVLCAYAQAAPTEDFSVWQRDHVSQKGELMNRGPSSMKVKTQADPFAAKTPIRAHNAAMRSVFWLGVVILVVILHTLHRLDVRSLDLIRRWFHIYRVLVRCGRIEKFRLSDLCKLGTHYEAFLDAQDQAVENVEQRMGALNRITGQHLDVREFEVYLEEYVGLSERFFRSRSDVPYKRFYLLHHAVEAWFGMLEYDRQEAPEEFGEAITVRNNAIWELFCAVDAEIRDFVNDRKRAEETARGSRQQDHETSRDHGEFYDNPSDRARHEAAPRVFRLLGVTLEQLLRMGENELTRIYRRARTRHHPDKGGRDEDFAELKDEYKEAMDYLRAATA